MQKALAGGNTVKARVRVEQIPTTELRLESSALIVIIVPLRRILIVFTVLIVFIVKWDWDARRAVVYGVSVPYARSTSMKDNRTSKTVPAQFAISCIFQLGIEISGSILRNHPREKVGGGDSGGASCWQEFSWR